MAKRRKRKKKRFKKLRKKAGFLTRIIRGIAAVLILTGSLLIIFLFLEQVSSLSERFATGEKIFRHAISVFVPSELDDESTPKEYLSKREDVVLTIGLFADSEGQGDNLKRALDIMEELPVDAAFFLGDLTRWGSVEELSEQKTILDSSDLEIFVIPGDHDLAASVSRGDVMGRSKFMQVFGQNNHIYEKEGYTFLLLDNSANYSKVSDEDLNWFEENLPNADFVILAQPLYHPNSSRVMGIVNGDKVSTVYYQAQNMLDMIRESDVKAIIAADHHLSSENVDPERGTLKHFVIGALVSNTPELRNLQTPRFAVLSIFSDGTYRVEDVTL